MLGLSPDVHRLHSTSTGWSPLYVTDNLSVMSIVSDHLACNEIYAAPHGSCHFRFVLVKGFMLPSTDSAVIWRGPKKNGMIKQFLKDVDWVAGESGVDADGHINQIDFMVIDTPPGTSDEHLSITSYLKESGITGAIVLTTPQEVAIQDVRRIISFCRKTSIPILGVVENMSGFICGNCNGISEIFLPTTGGAERLCREEGLDLLGKIPLDAKIGKGCDFGQDWLQEFPESVATQAYYTIVDRVKAKIALLEQQDPNNTSCS